MNKRCFFYVLFSLLVTKVWKTSETKDDGDTLIVAETLDLVCMKKDVVFVEDTDIKVTCFFLSNTVISNNMLKLAKLKEKLSNTIRLNFYYYLKIIIHIHVVIQKEIFQTMYKKQVGLFRACYMIYDNDENETENEK